LIICHWLVIEFHRHLAAAGSTSPARRGVAIPLQIICELVYVGLMLATTSAAEAGRVLDLDPHTIAKLKDAAVLVGPSNKPGRRTGIYARSLETAEAVLPTTVAKGDIAIHLNAFGPDSDHHGGRTYAGWHQEKSLALPVAQRRQCWAGVWNMDRGKAVTHIGHHAAATVGGFIVDIAGVGGVDTCQCCGLVCFDLQDPDPEAIALYRGRRLIVRPGSLWTV
jgi:hypothetical protein